MLEAKNKSAMSSDLLRILSLNNFAKEEGQTKVEGGGGRGRKEEGEEEEEEEEEEEDVFQTSFQIWRFCESSISRR